MPVIPAEDLRNITRQLMLALQVEPATADLVASSLVAASLRGVDSHGMQLLPYYIEQIEAGDMDPHAQGEVVSESGCCLRYHGHNGIGQKIANEACDHAIRLCKQYGIGMAVTLESNHFGAAAWWSQKMAAGERIGITMCNASPIVPPWQGKEGRLGTNPICVSLPGPWLLDMATTTVAAGKIFKAKINGQPTIPAGWAMDSEGVPTTSTEDAYKGLLMPLGGYKGSGLAMMVEILCAVLSGGGLSTELGGIRFRGTQCRVSQNFIAIDITRFMPLDEFRARIEKLIAMIKSAPVAKGYDEIMVAGEPEWQLEAQRQKDGVPVGQGTWDAIVAAGQRLGVTV